MTKKVFHNTCIKEQNKIQNIFILSKLKTDGKKVKCFKCKKEIVYGSGFNAMLFEKYSKCVHFLKSMI